MILIVHEFKSTFQSGTLWQNMDFLNDADVGYIRPHLLRVGSPAGTVQMIIYDQNDVVVKKSPVYTITNILPGSTYVHGFWPFEIKHPFKAGTYKILLATAGGYTFGGTNYLGWCNDWDLRKYEPAYTVNGPAKAPLDMEFWTYDWSDNMRVLDFDDGFESSTEPTITDMAIAQSIFQPVVNNQVAAANVTGMVFDKDDYHKARVECRVWRKTDSGEKAESFNVWMEYKPTAATWVMEFEGRNEESGVDFSIDASTGQVKYVSDNMAGANHTGYIKWIKTTFDKE